MARRRSRRSKGQVLFYILSVIIVLSMALGYAMIASPPPEPTPVASPTVPPATPEPTLAGATPQASSEPSASPTAVAPLPVTQPTSDLSATAYSFAVIGDSRDNPDVYKALLQQAVDDGNSFVIHLGDLVSDGTAAEYETWREVMAGFSLPFYSLPGNDDASDSSLANYLAFTGVAGAHYSFDWGQVHFALVDSHLGYLTAEESAWLDSDLARTTQPVKIVALHYPPFDPHGSNNVMTMGNESFVTLMKKHDVQYVFAGHIDAYDQVTSDGIVYIISGGGGAELARSESEGGFYHYVQVTVNGTNISTAVRRLNP